MRRVIFVFLLLPVSCRPHVVPAPSVGDPDSTPTNAEVLAYLEGKILLAPGPGSKAFTVSQSGIEALSVSWKSRRTDGGDWSTPISFVYNTGRARYTVDAVLEHRTVGDQRIFCAFALKRIVRR